MTKRSKKLQLDLLFRQSPITTKKSRVTCTRPYSLWAWCHQHTSWDDTTCWTKRANFWQCTIGPTAKCSTHLNSMNAWSKWALIWIPSSRQTTPNTSKTNPRICSCPKTIHCLWLSLSLRGANSYAVRAAHLWKLVSTSPFSFLNKYVSELEVEKIGNGHSAKLSILWASTDADYDLWV